MRIVSSVALSIVTAGFIVMAVPVEKSMAVQKTIKPQTMCPVMGDPINKKIYVDYKGYRIYFCCKSCPEEFLKNPDKYMKILRQSGVTLEKAKKKMKGGG